jgi:hypothetical protein
MRQTQRKGKNKRSLKSTRDDETDIQGNVYERRRRKSLKPMNETPFPCCGMMFWLNITHAHRISSRGGCAHQPRAGGKDIGLARSTLPRFRRRTGTTVLRNSPKRKQRTVVGNQCPIQIHHCTHRAQHLSRIAGQACWEVGGKGSAPLPGAGCRNNGSWCTAG